MTESRALACDLVAFQFLALLSQKELIDHLLFELPVFQHNEQEARSNGAQGIYGPVSNRNRTDEASPLLDPSRHERHTGFFRPPYNNMRGTNISSSDLLGADADTDNGGLAESMAGMNALEIAAVANAKKFLSQKPVQAVVEDIWHGEIIFWPTLSTEAKKHPQIYNKRTADPFSRLRVPKYQKAFQVAFFAAFLALYYAVLLQRSPGSITATEVLLYVWIAAFAYDEFGEFRDAGMLFYGADFWSVWDLAIILVGIAFFITRIVGLLKSSSEITDVAFDILSMLALFLVPRICSVASLNPYFGSLLPVLKEMVRSQKAASWNMRTELTGEDYCFLQIFACYLHTLPRILDHFYDARSGSTQRQRSVLVAYQGLLRV